MSEGIVIHGFETSNNIKVRIGLGYKKLPYEFRSIDPAERGDIEAMSGQYLTPVMQHGDVALFDSAAILRYLDANFPNTPKLFGRDAIEQWAIEDWELFGRLTLAAPMMRVVHARVAGREVPDELLAGASVDLEQAAMRLNDALQDHEWLVGETLTAADITGAAVIYRIRSSGVLPLPEGIDVLHAWTDRVMAYDGVRAET